MALPPMPQDTADTAGDVVAEPPTLLDLEAGPGRITPVWSPAEGVQYSIELPDGPLSPEDAEYLTVGLQTAQSGGVVLVDIDEYAETEQRPLR